MPRRPTQSDWNRFDEAARRKSKKVCDALVLGGIALLDFEGAFADFLEDRHSQAAYLGRRRGGDFSDFGELDRDMGRLIREEETPFYQAFASDVTGGRYGGPAAPPIDGEPAPWKEDALNARAEMYVGKMLGTANEAFAATSYNPSAPADEQELFDWDLGAAVEEHCDVCPERAAGGPYAFDALPGFPGDGSTPCLGNCACFIRRSDGVTGFRRPDA